MLDGSKVMFTLSPQIKFQGYLDQNSVFLAVHSDYIWEMIRSTFSSQWYSLIHTVAMVSYTQNCCKQTKMEVALQLWCKCSYKKAPERKNGGFGL